MLKKAKEYKSEEIKKYIYAPQSGIFVPIDKVPSPVFNKKVFGDGFAIADGSNKVVAPCDGQIVSIHPSKQTFGIRTEHNIDILVHVGLDIENFGQDAFFSKLKKGDIVKKGDLLVTLDTDFLKTKKFAMYTMTLITETDKVISYKIKPTVKTEAGKTELLSYRIKRGH